MDQELVRAASRFDPRRHIIESSVKAELDICGPNDDGFLVKLGSVPLMADANQFNLAVAKILAQYKPEDPAIAKVIKWRKFYLGLAKTWAGQSKDPRKKVGCVITHDNREVGSGYNGFPKGIADTPARLNDKELKNLIMIHAEVNALFLARGVGDTAYIWPCLPCTQCLGNLDQNGIKTIVVPPINLDSSWRFDIVLEMAKEMKIEIIEVEL